MHTIFYRHSYGYDSKKVLHNLISLIDSEKIRVIRGALKDEDADSNRYIYE